MDSLESISILNTEGAVARERDVMDRPGPPKRLKKADLCKFNRLLVIHTHIDRNSSRLTGNAIIERKARPEGHLTEPAGEARH